MKEDLLSAVVEVEKELARDLETEKARVRDMLAHLRQDSEQKISVEEKLLQEALNQAITDSVIRSEKRASEILEKADATASQKKGDTSLISYSANQKIRDVSLFIVSLFINQIF